MYGVICNLFLTKTFSFFPDFAHCQRKLKMDKDRMGWMREQEEDHEAYLLGKTVGRSYGAQQEQQNSLPPSILKDDVIPSPRLDTSRKAREDPMSIIQEQRRKLLEKMALQARVQEEGRHKKKAHSPLRTKSKEGHLDNLVDILEKEVGKKKKRKKRYSSSSSSSDSDLDAKLAKELQKAKQRGEGGKQSTNSNFSGRPNYGKRRSRSRSPADRRPRRSPEMRSGERKHFGTNSNFSGTSDRSRSPGDRSRRRSPDNSSRNHRRRSPPPRYDRRRDDRAGVSTGRRDREWERKRRNSTDARVADEERDRKLREMMSNAQEVTESRKQIVSRLTEEEEKEEREWREGRGKEGHEKTRRRALEDGTVEQRIMSSKHKLQRGSDSHKFGR